MFIAVKIKSEATKHPIQNVFNTEKTYLQLVEELMNQEGSLTFKDEVTFSFYTKRTEWENFVEPLKKLSVNDPLTGKTVTTILRAQITVKNEVVKIDPSNS
tara:strand:- start:315 stop:617 length:303 start_codon:yes stop_codon:yes gene_type:complete